MNGRSVRKEATNGQFAIYLLGENVCLSLSFLKHALAAGVSLSCPPKRVDPQFVLIFHIEFLKPTIFF